MIPMKTFLVALAFALAMNWLLSGAAKADCALQEVEPSVTAVAPASDWQDKAKQVAAQNQAAQATQTASAAPKDIRAK